MSRLAGRGLALAALGLAVFGMAACGQKDAPAPSAAAPAGPPPTPTLEQLKGATVSGVFDQAVTLANGKYDGPPAEPGAASHPTLMLWESAVAFGDMDGAPGNEAVALLSSNSGGSGEFVYIAVFGVRDGQLVNLGTAEVGDRVQLRTLWLEKGKAVMDVVEAGPKDPACCPTQLARKAYAWKDGKLELASNEVVGSLSINLLAATDWVLVAMDGQALPEGTVPPTALIQYGKAAGFAGCNRYTGPITESEPGAIKIGDLAVTRKACDGPANEIEAAFLERLGKTQSYSFQAGQLLLAGPSDGQGARTLLFSR